MGQPNLWRRGTMMLLVAALFALAGCSGSDTGQGRIDADTGGADTSPPECETDTDCAGSFALATCEQAACEQGACVRGVASDGTACDDGDLCTTGDACAAGVCAGTEVQCPPAGDCELAACDAATGECVVSDLADGSPCDDRDPCTAGDACEAGECQAGDAPSCDDDDPCTDDACDPATGECSHTSAPDGTACDDGLFCTASDACAAGVCVGTGDPCGDDDPCTEDSCDDTFDDCVYTPPSCDDEDPCTANTWDPVTCACEFPTLEDGAACDDGAPCTTGDVCTAGVCMGVPAEEDCCLLDRHCDDGDPCTEERCLFGTQSCQRDPVLCDPDPTRPCSVAVCEDDGSCGARDILRPVVLWRRGFDSDGLGGLRLWPPTAWTRVPGAGPAGEDVMATDEAAVLRMPPLDIQPGTHTIEVVWRPATACAGENALELRNDDDEVLATATCPDGRAGWQRTAFDFAAPTPRVARPTVAVTGRLELEILAVELVHWGRNGCPLATPVTVDTTHAPTNLGLAAGPGLDATLMWRENEGAMLEATLAPLVATGEAASLADGPVLLADDARIEAEWSGTELAACWGRESLTDISHALHRSPALPADVELSLDAGVGFESGPPDLVSLGNSQWFYVWQAVPTGEGDPALVAQRLATDGTVLTDIVQLEAYADTPFVPAGAFDLIPLRGDNVALALVDGVFDGKTVSLRVLDPTVGEVSGDPSVLDIVNTDWGEDLGHPAAVQLADGDAAVAWQRYEPEVTDGWDLVYAVVTPGENTGTPPRFALADDDTNDQEHPQLLALPDGGFLAMWLSDHTGRRELNYRVVEADGTLGPVQVFAHIPDGVVSLVSAAAADRLADGRIAVAWIDQSTTALRYTILPGPCPQGWWTCEANEVLVCTGAGYLPLVGTCTGEGCEEPLLCP